VRWRLWCLLIVVGKVTGGEVESGAAVRGGRRKARTARSPRNPASLLIGRAFRGADALLFGQSGPFLVGDCALAAVVAADCDGKGDGRSGPFRVGGYALAL